MNGVTAKKIAASHTSDKCNAQDPEDVLAGIEADLAGLGFQKPSDEERAKRVRRYEASEHAKICAECGNALAADAAIFRVKLYLGLGLFGGHRYGIYPVCSECAEEEDYPTRWQKCDSCGRDVRQPDWQPRKHNFCSDVCGAKFYREQRKALPEPIECETCGEFFEPARSDAKTCSPACRQKAYRKRWALQIAEATVGAFDTRNGAAK